MELKMADFQNHRRFTLRCLSQDLIPVSIKLKTTVKTPKGIYIVRKAERMLMNERVRSINNTITMFRWQIDTCINMPWKPYWSGSDGRVSWFHKLKKGKKTPKHFREADQEI